MVQLKYVDNLKAQRGKFSFNSCMVQLKSAVNG